MEEIRTYKIMWSPSFIRELDKICNYMATDLKEPNIAKAFYGKMMEKLNSLRIFPERHKQMQVRDIAFRKLLVKNYVIIYQIDFKLKEVLILFFTEIKIIYPLFNNYFYFF